MSQVKECKDSIKFITKASEDKNEVLLFAKGFTECGDTEKRIANLGKVCNSLELNKGVFMNKKTMQIVMHTELMRKL